MLKRLLLCLAIALPLALPALAPLALAQTNPFFQIPFIRVQGAEDIKFPEVAAHGNIVSVGGNTDGDQAFFWEKTDTADVFGGPFDLGTAGGPPDYSTVTVDYASDGTLYYVWSDFNARRINIRVRPPGQDFGPIMLVTGASPFPSEPDVAVTENNGQKTIFVFWREAAGQIRYRFSQDNGVSWTPTGTVVEERSQPEISAYGGPGGRVAVGYTREGGSSGNLQAYVSIWNGSAFVTERISPDRSGDFAEPTVAVQPDGRWVAIYRGVVRNGNWGTYIAARNPDGTWDNTAPFGRIDRGDIGSIWMDVDPQGNWHMLWSGVPDRTGQLNVYYAKRLAEQGTLTQAIASGGRGTVFNVSGALNMRENVYTHAVYERFEGGGSTLAYSMVNSPGTLPGADAISIEQGAQITTKTSVRVDFANARNSPTQVRYRWGAAPTAADPVLPFTNPLTVPLPTLTNPSGCNELVLYTQLIGAGGTQQGFNTDTIVVDQAVQASADIAAAQPGPDPAFTRTTSTVVTVRAANECAGLESATVSGGASNVSIPISGQDQASASVTLSGSDGQKTLNVAMTDRAGNTATQQLKITLDTRAPDLQDPGDVDIAEGSDFSGIVDVELSGVDLSEANPYGVQVTVRYTPTSGSPVTGSPQVLPLSLSGGRGSFSFSLASGLPAGTARAGNYQLTIRFIDKAGNVSQEASTGTIAFSQNPSFPRLYLPTAQKAAQ